MSIETLYNETASTVREAKKTLADQNIDINKVMRDIYEEILTYAVATKTDSKIDVEASGKSEDKISLHDKIVATISNYIEPSISLVVFKIVNRGNTISVIKKQ